MEGSRGGIGKTDPEAAHGASAGDLGKTGLVAGCAEGSGSGDAGETCPTARPEGSVVAAGPDGSEAAAEPDGSMESPEPSVNTRCWSESSDSPARTEHG